MSIILGPHREFRVNEFITLKLEWDGTILYVNDE